MGDFHFESLRQKIVPIVLMNPASSRNQSLFNSLSLKVSGHNIAGHNWPTLKKYGANTCRKSLINIHSWMRICQSV